MARGSGGNWMWVFKLSLEERHDATDRTRLAMMKDSSAYRIMSLVVF